MQCCHRSDSELVSLVSFSFSPSFFLSCCFRLHTSWPIYTAELDSVEYLLKHYLKVIFSGLRNAKWPYLDLFYCLETFRRLRAVEMAGINFLTLDEGNQA
jgi:hypothetical protein